MSWVYSCISNIQFQTGAPYCKTMAFYLWYLRLRWEPYWGFWENKFVPDHHRSSSFFNVGYNGYSTIISNVRQKQTYRTSRYLCIPVEYKLKLLGQTSTLEWFVSLLYIQSRTVKKKPPKPKIILLRELNFDAPHKKRQIYVYPGVVTQCLEVYIKMKYMLILCNICD